MMCVSSLEYHVKILKVRGAHHMLLDPDWKAEDQRGTQARTIGCNNNDEDVKCGYMPSWMFKVTQYLLRKSEIIPGTK